MKKFLFGTFLGAILGGIGWCALDAHVRANIEGIDYSDYLDKDIKVLKDYANDQLDKIHENLEEAKEKLTNKKESD